MAHSNKIKIKIPIGLSESDEIKMIAQRLTQKMLSGDGKNEQILIGQYVEIQNIHTQIEIERVSPEPIIEMVTCNVCGSDYQSNLFSKYFHNYGGRIKMMKCCSSNCVDFMIDNFGDRVAKSKSKLKPLFIQKHYSDHEK